MIFQIKVARNSHFAKGKKNCLKCADKKKLENLAKKLTILFAVGIVDYYVLSQILSKKAFHVILKG